MQLHSNWAADMQEDEDAVGQVMTTPHIGRLHMFTDASVAWFVRLKHERRCEVAVLSILATRVRLQHVFCFPCFVYHPAVFLLNMRSAGNSCHLTNHERDSSKQSAVCNSCTLITWIETPTRFCTSPKNDVTHPAWAWGLAPVRMF